MKAKLLLGALVVCGLLAIPSSAGAGCCGGSGLFGGGGLFNGCGLFNGNIVSRIHARRVARISNRIECLEGERSALLDGKRPRAARRNCEDGTCDVTPEDVTPEAEAGAFLEIQSPSILDDIVNLDVRITSPSSILSSVGLGSAVE